MQNNNFITQIENEYESINKKWLALHKKIALGFAAASSLVEFVMLFVMYSTDTVTATVPVYILKYILLPIFLNALFVSAIYLLPHWFPKRRKLHYYITSLCFVAICFTLFSAHNIFSALSLLFMVPLMLTTIYGDYLLTTITAVCCYLSVFVGELLITWDPDKPNTLADELSLINFSLSLLILLGFYLTCLVVIFFEQMKNQASIRKEIERYQLKQEILMDDLTSLYNKSALMDALAQIGTEPHRHIFVMIDIDNFKELNDTFGHVKGDAYLKEIGRVLKAYCSPHPVFRFGGDEFSVLFTDMEVQTVVEICRQIQAEFQSFSARESDTCSLCSVSASFGVAACRQGMTPELLLKAADSALYCSKRKKGSICVSAAEDFRTQ